MRSHELTFCCRTQPLANHRATRMPSLLARTAALHDQAARLLLKSRLIRAKCLDEPSTPTGKDRSMRTSRTCLPVRPRGPVEEHAWFISARIAE